MNQIIVKLNQEQSRKLEEAALRLQVTPDMLIQREVDDFLERLDPELEKALEYVLNKNAELYRRLA